VRGQGPGQCRDESLPHLPATLAPCVTRPAHRHWRLLWARNTQSLSKRLPAGPTNKPKSVSFASQSSPSITPFQWLLSVSHIAQSCRCRFAQSPESEPSSRISGDHRMTAPLALILRPDAGEAPVSRGQGPIEKLIEVGEPSEPLHRCTIRQTTRVAGGSKPVRLLFPASPFPTDCPTGEGTARKGAGCIRSRSPLG
jgi:hypothetical protein